MPYLWEDRQSIHGEMLQETLWEELLLALHQAEVHQLF